MEAALSEIVEASEYWRLHGSHEPITLPSPVAGSGLTHTVPGTVMEQVLSVSFVYSCSGAAGTRVPRIDFLDYGGVPFASVQTPFTLIATNVCRVTFGVGVQQFGAASAAEIGAGIPAMCLGDGLSWTLTATGILAADTITAARAFVRQWRVRP